MSARIIPERIREARESVGMTDEQFAEAIGVSRQSVGTYETGAFAPRGDVFTAVACQPSGADTFELFTAIQTQNPYAAEVVSAFVGEAQSLLRQVGSGKG